MTCITEYYRTNMGGPGCGMIPKGVGAPPPPGMDNRRGKLMCIKVRMLDDSVGVFHLGVRYLYFDQFMLVYKIIASFLFVEV